jgi:tRNA pseudouridine55 synthase
MNGLILLKKPKGITSFSVLNDIKRKLGIKRVGHTGTLDKFAEGLLIVLTGSLTRLASLFLDLSKSYKAIICFGRETTTLDPSGELVARGPVPERATINLAVESFLGRIAQVPPQYSAVHVDGIRAYQYARGGKKVALKARTVTIYNMTVSNYEAPLLTLDITCSKGTYIRALARDLAYKLHTHAYVHELSRYRIGPFLLSEAVDPEGFDPGVHVQNAAQFLKRLTNIGSLTIRDEYRFGVAHGRALCDKSFIEEGITPGAYALFSSNNEFIALVNKIENSYRYQMVVAEG